MRSSLLAFVMAVLASIGSPGASAQPSPSVPILGIITPHASPDAPPWRVFRAQLAKLGYVEGRTIHLVFGFADGDLTRMPALAKEMAMRKVNVLVTDGGVVSASAAQAATSTIPIVAATFGGDPVASGFVQTMARPGGNITGFSTASSELAAKRLELVKEVMPYASHVGVAWNRAGTDAQAKLMMQAAPAFTLKVTPVPLDITSDLKGQIEAAAALGIEVLIVMPDGALFHRRSELISSIAGARLAAMYPEREYVDAGGLMSYGPPIMDNFRGTADYVDKILRGVKVADLPVQAPSRFEFILNQKVARAQALSWPEGLLNRADEVIE
jgi:putative tryptophan/tyrosine transport system substrate-binding protein